LVGERYSKGHNPKARRTEKGYLERVSGDGGLHGGTRRDHCKRKRSTTLSDQMAWTHDRSEVTKRPWDHIITLEEVTLSKSKRQKGGDRDESKEWAATLCRRKGSGDFYAGQEKGIEALAT